MTRFGCALGRAAIVLAGLACAGRSQSDGSSAPPGDREKLTPAEFNQRSFYSAYDAVAALRPLWLKAAVQVYVDENHLGGLEALGRIRILDVALMRHLDGIQATARYGRNHEAGAILVTTRAADRQTR